MWNLFATCLSHCVDFYLDFYPFSCTPLITHTNTRTNFHASFLRRDGIIRLAVSLWLHFSLLHIESNYIVINYHINLYLAQKSVEHREREDEQNEWTNGMYTMKPTHSSHNSNEITIALTCAHVLDNDNDRNWNRKFICEKFMAMTWPIVIVVVGSSNDERHARNNLPNNHFFFLLWHIKIHFVHDNRLMYDISILAIVYIIDKNIHIHWNYKWQVNKPFHLQPSLSSKMCRPHLLPECIDKSKLWSWNFIHKILWLDFLDRIQTGGEGQIPSFWLWVDVVHSEQLKHSQSKW